jgi:Ca2+-binding EF-hand superfamily protein
MSSAAAPGTASGKKYSAKQMAEFKIQFQAFDKDKDGLITADELMTVFKSINQVYTQEEIQDMITEIDVDGDGKINLDEFIVYMEGKTGKSK